MVYQYENRLDDYLDAMALQKANARRNRVVLHLIVLLVAGCLVYMNLSTLRLSFDRNDTVSYGAALVVMAVLLVAYSPKIIPSLVYPIRQQLGMLPLNAVGPREFEINEHYLCFRYGGTEVRVGYEGVVRVNHNDHTVLFYLQNGTIESVPLRAIGVNAQGRTETLQKIQNLAQKANSRKRLSQLPPWMENPLGSMSCGVGEENVLACSMRDLRVQRRNRIRSFYSWLFLFILALSCIGCLFGLTHLDALPDALQNYLKGFYFLEIPGCLIAMVFWYRPTFLAKWTIRQSLMAGNYPIGYLGERLVEWDENCLAFRYGVFGLRIEWDWVGAVHEDEKNLCFYHGGTMFLFLPKDGIDPAFTAFLKSRNY